MELRLQTMSGLFAAPSVTRRRWLAPICLASSRVVAVLALTMLPLLPACQSEPGPASDLKLARKVEQVLEDPTSLPLSASPAAAEALALAEPATPAAAATPTEAPAAPTAVVAAPDPAAVAAAQAAVAFAAAAEKAEKAKAEKAEKQAKAEKADKSEKPDKTDKADKADKQDRAAKEDAAKAKAAAAEDVVIPEGADATDLYTSGKRKLAAGDYPGAIQDLRASNKLRYSVRTLTTLGRAYFDAGQMAQAEKSFKAAGTFDEAMLLLAQLYQQSGKPGQARKVYEHFLQIHADHPKAEWARKMVQAL